MQTHYSVFTSFLASKKYIQCLFLSLLIALPIQAAETATSTFSKRNKIKKINDIRIIVDISGSMKRTDPNNLRRSAVRLLAGLVPEGSRAGIWNFGKQVNMAVKIGTVNDAWRDLARAESKKISSVGLYTNIESVLRKVSFDWRKEDPHYKRNIIFLTDGHVDVSKDDSLDKSSRTRILNEILPRLERSKVRIHTIALSDDVDESLLSTLSAYTDGLYKKVDSADDLQKLFLQMLEQSIKLDTLPIKNNHFNVDTSINDMTLLVFNKDKSSATKIITPGNKSWNEKSHSGSVKWFSDDGYDLITIKKPEKGAWKIEAPTDPNNRVVVATNLKLRTNDIPSYLIMGNALNVSAHLEEDGKPLTDQRLLSKFNFTLEKDAVRASERRYPLSKSENDEFSYSVALAAKFKEGNNELVIQAKSPTAEREIRHQLRVYTTPADIKISENHGKYSIELKPHLNILRPESINISIELKDKSIHKLKKKNKIWSVEVDKKFAASIFKVNIKANGADGKPLSMNFDKELSTHNGVQKLDLAEKFKAQKKTEAQHKPEKDHAVEEAETKTETENDSENKHVVEEKEKEKEKDKGNDTEIKNEETPEHVSDGSEKETNWIFVISSIVIGNLLLAGVFLGGYIFMKRRKAKLADKVSDELAEVDLEEESKDK